METLLSYNDEKETVKNFEQEKKSNKNNNGKKELSSKEFTKKYLRYFIGGYIIISIIFGIIDEIVKDLPSIISNIISFLFLYLVVKHAYLSSIEDVFKEGMIYKEDIGKISRNIIIIVLVTFLFNIVISDIIPYIAGLEAAKWLGIEKILLKKFIIKIIVAIIIYGIIGILSKNKFLNECEKEENVI